MEFTIIVAKDEKDGIGKNGGIPWDDPEDRKFFAKTTRDHTDDTQQNAVIMGRVTYASIGKLLPYRLNIIVSNEDLHIDGARVATSLDGALAIAKATNSHRTFVIGGERLYREAIEHPLCREIIVTMIPGDYQCDRKFPEISDSKFYMSGHTNDDRKVDIERYKRKTTGEHYYIHLLQDIKTNPARPNRTGVPTRSMFAKQLEFNLRDADKMILPLLTTKSVPFRVVYEELLWFISGGTEARSLQEKNVHIWDGNSTREYLDKRGLTHYREGELGPIYGFQWRHWGATYLPEKERTTKEISHVGNCTVDQLQTVIAGIQNDPWDRRHVVSAWNPSDLSQMALPPCHILFQFYVDPDDNGKPKHLSCSMYQRSADAFLGVPFNIASYALLTHMVARVCGLQAKRLVITMGDCHIYENHLDAVNEQIKRSTRGFPHITFDKTIEEKGDSLTIDDFRSDSIVLHQYYPHPTIKAPMAV